MTDGRLGGARADVVRECARIVLDGLLLPFRCAVFVARLPRLRAEIAADLRAPAAVADAPAPAGLPERPLRIFVSCAEPSGEIHALSLVDALRAELARAGAPAPELFGVGGARLRARGVTTLGDPVARAAMGSDAVRSFGFYFELTERVARHFRETPPDVFLPVDSPALHVPWSHVAQRAKVPVVHFVTPQYWGWAPWRAHAYRRAVDLALSILPFEPAWFARRGIRVAHVGHPLLDALPPEGARAPAASRTLVLLPGSRTSVIERNLPWMLAAASRLRLVELDLDVVIPHARAELADAIAACVERAGATAWVRLERGELGATLSRARAALSVSGTVLIDLLHQRVPAVVVYRLRSRLAAALARTALVVPWFSSVNLLAARTVYPEYCFRGAGPFEEVCAALARCYKDEAWRATCAEGLDEAARRLGPPGATARAARHALALVCSRHA